MDASRADGLTPLCQASKAGHVRCVELLLHAKANVEAAGFKLREVKHVFLDVVKTIHATA